MRIHVLVTTMTALGAALFPFPAWGQAIDMRTDDSVGGSTSRFTIATSTNPNPATMTVLNSRLIFDNSSGYLRVPLRSSDPSADEGGVYYHTTNDALYTSNGSTWRRVAFTDETGVYIQANPSSQQSAYFNVSNAAGNTIDNSAAPSSGTLSFLSIGDSGANLGASTASRRGVFVEIDKTGDTTANEGVYSIVSGGGSSNTAVTGTASGTTATGVFGHTGGSGVNGRGVLARNESTGAGSQYGVSVEVYGTSGVVTKYGVRTDVWNTATTSYGYYADVSGATTNYGGWLRVGQPGPSGSAVPNVLVLETAVDSTDVGANGIGTGLLFRAESGTNGSFEDAARIQGILTDVTAGSAAGALVFLTHTDGGAMTEKMRIDNAGIVTPGTSLQDLGSSGLRWDLYGGTGDFSNTLTVSSGSLQALNLTSTTGTSDAVSLTATSLTSGRALNITTSSNPAAAGPISPITVSLTNANATTATTMYGVDIGLTNNPTIAANSEYAMRIQNKLTSNTTDNAVAALLLLDNADTTATGTTVVTDAIKITNSGGAGYTNLLETPSVDISSAGAISGVTSISMSSSLTVGDSSGTDLLSFGSAGRFRLPKLTADQSTEGDFWYDDTNNLVKYYTTAVQTVATLSSALLKNQSSTETASLTLNGVYLYEFTNSSTTTGSGVLKSTATGGTGSNGSFYGLYGDSSRTDNSIDSTPAYCYGVYGTATGTSSGGGSDARNYGVYGYANGAQGSGGVINYGVYGLANGTPVDNIGVYGSATPGSTSTATTVAVEGIATDAYALGTANTRNLYGGYFTATKSGTSTNGTLNNYGVYASATNSSGGTETAYGIYAAVATVASTTAYAGYFDAGTGGGTEYAGVFMNGSVGIGTATPTNGRLEISDATTTANFAGLYVAQSGAAAGTNYGLYVAKTGASTANVAGYFSASGGTDNYALIVPSGGGNVGIGATSPLALLEVNGGLAIRSSGSVVTITADGQSVTVGNRSYIRLDSDNTTSTLRTFTLTNGLVEGHRLVLEWTHATNEGELAEGGNVVMSTTIWPAASSQVNDALELIWNGTNWIELSRSAN